MNEALIADNLWLLALIMLWVLPWKGYALWSAAKREDKWWFIALLIINTLAILDIIYIFAIAKRGPALKRLLGGEKGAL